MLNKIETYKSKRRYFSSTRRSIFSLIVLLGLSLLHTQALASNDLWFPRFSLDANDLFIRLPSLPTEEIPAQLPEVSFRIFSNVTNTCSARQIRKQLKEALSIGNFNDTLSNVDPSWRQRLMQQNTIVLFDDLSFSRSRHRMYFHRFLAERYSLIWVDCRSLQGDSIALGAGLAHEFTHILLLDREVPTWFNEGVAQLAEVEAGGRVPVQMFEDLRNAQVVPGLFIQEPFYSKKLYGFTYLFARFLYQYYGGWNAIVKIHSGVPHLQGAFIDYVAQNLNDDDETNPKDGASLLRHFLRVMSETPLVLEGWRGFALTSARMPPRSKLEPGQIFHIIKTELVGPLNKNLIHIETSDETWVMNPTGDVQPAYEIRF